MDKKEEGTATPHSPALSEKQRRELWIYLAGAICAVEMLITVGAVLYGFIGSSGDGRPAFPWILWGALMAAAPSALLLAVHSAGVGLFTAPREGDEEWQKRLPERIQRIYRIIRGAPAVVVLLGAVAFGVALITVDGLLNALARFAGSLTPYIPHILAALVAIFCAIAGASVWLNYRTRKLHAEYDFRREVLYKTGVIIVDKDSTPLPPGGNGEMPYAIASAETMEPLPRPALPQGPLPSGGAETPGLPGPGAAASSSGLSPASPSAPSTASVTILDVDGEPVIKK